MINRKNLHEALDKILDEMGFKEEFELKWGAIAFEVKFEAGRAILSVRERETRKNV